MPQQERQLGYFVYPWGDWLKKSAFTLKQGRDFDCMPHSMAQQVRNTARKYQKKVSVKIEEDTLKVTVTKGHK